MLVSLVTGACLLLSVSLLTTSLCSAPMWEVGGAPALVRVTMVTTQLVVVSLSHTLAFNFYFFARHEDMKSVESKKYVLNIRRRESQNSAVSRPNASW